MATNPIKRVHDFALDACLYLATAIVALMAVLGGADAASGAFFNRPIAGTQELSQILLPTAFFLVLGKVQQLREHIVIDIVSSSLPERIRGHLARLGTLVGALVLGVVAWRLWVNAVEALHILQRANAAVHIPVYSFKIASAFGTTFGALECLRQTIFPPSAAPAVTPAHNLEAL